MNAHFNFTTIMNRMYPSIAKYNNEKMNKSDQLLRQYE